MDSEIALIASGFLAVRLAVLMGVGYALYHVLRTAPAPARETVHTSDQRRAIEVCDDRC